MSTTHPIVPPAAGEPVTVLSGPAVEPAPSPPAPSVVMPPEPEPGAFAEEVADALRKGCFLEEDDTAHPAANRRKIRDLEEKIAKLPAGHEGDAERIFYGFRMEELKGIEAHPYHCCKYTDFNSMTDTCPGCHNPDPEGVIREAARRPYRHVTANHWTVHALLKYHYLPYWPRNVDQVFATIDIRTGTVVAACVFAFPVLRCLLREQVFGELKPESLNRDFRQLVRWMVHPDHRAANVGTDLLRWALTKVPQPVVEAINRSWVPTKVFEQLGMVERSDGDRHYYYRLKECRKREDEIANPPAQAEEKPGEVVHVYPRYWVQKARLQGQPRIVLVEAYAGAKIRAHVWNRDAYLVEMQPFDQSDMANRPQVVETVDVDEKARLAADIETGLPNQNLN